MSYLNPPYENTFKELCACMPLFYLDVYEMREILKAQGWLMDGINEAIELTIANNFIMTTDEPTVKKWETALKIYHEKKLTLDQRKRSIMGRVMGYGHIGEPEIREIIAQYTSGEVTVEFAVGVITVTVYGEIFDRDVLLDTLLKRIPAHLALILCNIIIAPELMNELFFAPGFGESLSMTKLPEIEPELPGETIYLAPVLGRGLSETTLPPIEPVFAPAVVAGIFAAAFHSVTETELPTIKEPDTTVMPTAVQRIAAAVQSVTETALPMMPDPAPTEELAIVERFTAAPALAVMETKLPPLPEFQTTLGAVCFGRATAAVQTITETILPEI